MSNENFDNETDPEGEEATPLVKQLRQQLKETQKASKDAADAVRELAFLKAGVDTSSKVGALLLKTYDGDLKDIEALRTEATELGVYKAPEAPATPPEGQPATPAEALAGQTVNMESTGSEQRQALANGAAGGDVQPEIPASKEALAKFQDTIKAGASWDDSAATFIQTLATRKAHEIGLTEHRQ